MLPMTEEEAAWRRAWLKKLGKSPFHGNNWLDAGAAYRDHLRDIRDSNRSDPPNPPADLPPSGGQVEHVVGRTLPENKP